MSDFTDDLDRRIKAALTEKLGISEQVAAMIAAEVQGGLMRDWRGERPYIGAAAQVAAQMSARNRAIIRAHRDGESIAFLARREGLSRQRVWAIIKG